MNPELWNSTWSLEFFFGIKYELSFTGHDNWFANIFDKIPCSVTREILVLNAFFYLEEMLMKWIVIGLVRWYTRILELSLQQDKDLADIYLWPNRLGHRFLKVYLVNCDISSVEIQCKVMAEILSVINTQWDILFLLSLSAELCYIEHFFAACIIFY